MYIKSIFHNNIKDDTCIFHIIILFSILSFINIFNQNIFTNDKILLWYVYKKKHHTIINLLTTISHYNKHRSFQLCIFLQMRYKELHQKQKYTKHAMLKYIGPDTIYSLTIYTKIIYFKRDCFSAYVPGYWLVDCLGRRILYPTSIWRCVRSHHCYE